MPYDYTTPEEVESQDPDKKVLTRQERALLYLERKRSRHERITQPIEAVNGNSRHAEQPAEVPRATVADPVAQQAQEVSQPAEVLPAAVADPMVQQAQKAGQPVTSPVTSAAPKRILPIPPSSSVDPAELLRWQRHKKLLTRHLARKHMRQARHKEHQASNRFWLAISTVVSSLLFIFISLTGAGAYASYQFYSSTQNQFLSKVLNLHDFVPRDNLKMYDSKGVLLAQLTDQGMHTSVPLDSVSQNLINATIATEDKNFWTNPGIDLFRIIQAAIDDLDHGRVVSGGSTITQQLIKGLIVGHEATFQRKLQEVVLTPLINDRYSKSDILEMYLNTIYYGEQAYGIDAAANVYFGLQDKPGHSAAQQLDLAQAAMLAGLPSSPEINDPLKHPDMAFQRFQYVLNRMVQDGYIKGIDALDAIREEQSSHFFKGPTGLSDRAPHFVNFVLTQLEHSFHLTRQQLSRSDMSVYTTLDIGLQDKIQKIAQERIAELRDSNHVTNAAEVLIDFHTGAIRSLLGSIDYNDKSIDGEYDVATQGYRQPGSSFKPYVYVTAFAQGASPAQAIDDKPLTIDLPGGDPPTFSPTNYDNKFHGHMTLRCALQNSLNVPAVKVLQHVGIDAAMQTAQNMGIASYEGTPGYSLVLGGLGVRLLDHTSAYGTFANGGVHVPYYSIEKVVFSSTHQTYGHAAQPGAQVISPQLAYMMTNVLSDNASRIPEFFDCNPLQLYSNSQYDCYSGNRGVVRPAAAKTGTTTDFRDNWTMGYTTDYVMGVWAGNDDNTPMYNVTGVQGAAPIWHDAMLVAEEGHPIRDFTNPGGLDRASVTYPDGVQTTDWFLPGTVPTFSQPDQQPDQGQTDGITGIFFPPSSDNQDHHRPIMSARPYCPSSYSFATPPPHDNQSSSDSGWW